MLRRVVSGIQPTGILHLGNYLGAVKNWQKLQNSNQCFFFIADNHSVTLKLLRELGDNDNNTSNVGREDPKLNNLVLNTASCLLACGIEPKNIFVQSHIHEHTELMWILSCITPLSWLNTMIQFKEKSKNNNKNASTGLYTYPILMAADILLYKGENIPVGEDQIQHIEITRTIAQRLNKLCKKEILPIPQYILNNQGSRVMSLQNGNIKMSKSDPNKNACLYLINSEEEIKAKILKAKTDPIRRIDYDLTNRPEVSNLISIYSSLENLSIENVVKKFENASMLEFKQELIKSMCISLLPISERARLLINKEQSYILDILHEGRKRAKEEAGKNIYEIKKNLNYLIY